jgi:hypothetical protein
MSVFNQHRSCKEIETILRTQIEDLHSERDNLYAKLEETTRIAAERQQDLMDRLLAFTNPGAYSRFAEARKPMQRNIEASGEDAKFLRPLPLINRDTGQPIVQRVGVKPALEPVPRNYRKALNKETDTSTALPDAATITSSNAHG